LVNGANTLTSCRFVDLTQAGEFAGAHVLCVALLNTTNEIAPSTTIVMTKTTTAVALDMPRRDRSPPVRLLLMVSPIGFHRTPGIRGVAPKLQRSYIYP